MTDLWICDGPGCDVDLTGSDPRTLYCSRTCQQRRYRAEHGRKEYRPKQKGKRPDTPYVIFPAAVLEQAVATTVAHDRDAAARGFDDDVVAVPARSLPNAH